MPPPLDADGEPLAVGQWYWVWELDELDETLGCFRILSIQHIEQIKYHIVELSGWDRWATGEHYGWQKAEGPPPDLRKHRFREHLIGG